MESVALVTCRALPSGDEDGETLLAALADLGVAAEWRAWDNPAVDWRRGLVVVRSTWDYTPRRDEFLAWARRVPRLANPADVIVWNSDKTYLRDLAEAGIAVVPSAFAAPGGPIMFPEDREFVVKPSVGAGSKGAGRFTSGQAAAALAHARVLHDSGRTVLVQPYIADVDAVGETSLIYIDGTYSHAITKAAMLAAGTVNALDVELRDSLFAQERIAATVATAQQLAVGECAMDFLAERHGGAALLYGRVDLLPTEDGPAIVELELTEPSLFLAFAAGATERFAAAIASRA